MATSKRVGRVDMWSETKLLTRLTTNRREITNREARGPDNKITGTPSPGNPHWEDKAPMSGFENQQG